MNPAITQSRLTASGKPSSTQSLEVVKGDIQACKQFASDYADKSNKPRHEALGYVWCRFIRWSYLGNAPKAGMTS